MDSAQEFGRNLSFIAWFSFMAIVCYQWIKGMFDFKSLLKLFGLVVAIALGYELIQMVVTSSSPDPEALSCTQKNNYLDCAGWPIFLTSLAYIAEQVLKFSTWAFAVSAAVVQFIAGIFLLSKFTKTVWTVDFKEVFLAFCGGCILYLSLLYMPYLSKSFMNMTQYLLGFSSHHGGFDNSFDEVNHNLSNWNSLIDGLIESAKDENYIIFAKVGTYISVVFAYALYALIKLPLFWFSFLNIIMLFMQQILILSLPLDAIRMCLSLNIDPLLVLKKLLAISMLSMAVVTEFHLLNWLPNPPELAVGAGVAVSLGAYLGLGLNALIILLIVIFSAIISTFIIFRSFYAGKEAISN